MKRSLLSLPGSGVDSSRTLACTRTSVSYETPATLPLFQSGPVPAASETFTGSETYEVRSQS